MLAALTGLATGHPKRVIASAAAAAALCVAAGLPAVDDLHPYSAADPGSESSRAAERVHDAIGLDPDAGLVALVEARAPVRSDAARRRVERIADAIFLDPAVGWVRTHYTTGDPAMVSRDGRATYLIANFRTLSDRAQQRGAERIRERLADVPGVSLGGEAPANLEGAETARSDILRAQLIAFPLLLALSLWFFRGLVAALLPPLVGGLAVAGALAGLRAVNALWPVSIFALNLVLGLALALALDYSLLVVSRFREELARGHDEREALRRTMRSAGRTVLFSSLAIALALAALLVFPQRFLYSMGIGGVLVALIAGAATLTVLPAALALLGRRVDALSPPWLRRAREREARPAAEGGWYRLSRFVTRRPAPIAAGCAALLVALGIPFLGARFEPPDVSALPPGAEARQVRDALDERFGPTPTLPLYLALDAPRRGEAKAFAARVARVAGVRRVEEPRAIGAGTTLVAATLAADPLSAQSQGAVREIRALGAPFEFALGGRAADFADQKASIASRLPLALALLCAAAALAVFLLTGSLALPLKAVAINLLTLSAALGLLVAIFQDGRLESLLAYTSSGALELSQPLILLAAGFGIATDYGIFLLARIKEAHDSGAPDREAIALGLERTGRIVTAAALVVCAALAAIATSRIVLVKELGLGIAFAVLLDATIVRALLVPSLMALLGEWNWWLPRPLRRLHSRLVRAPAG